MRIASRGPTVRSMKISRVGARVLAAVLVAVLLPAATAAPVQAESKTFKPPVKREYITSLTVISKPKVWRFEARTPRSLDDVISYTWFIDTPGPHTHQGAEFRLRLEGGEVKLFRRTTKSAQGEYAAACPGQKSGLLKDEDGHYISIPQDCLTYYQTDDFRVEKLAVRLAVEGLEETSWSPKKAPFAFHALVKNHPLA